MKSPPERYRVIVVGGGLAGLELVRELDLRGVRGVLLLEAGPADDLRHVNLAFPPETALRLWLEPETDTYFWQPWTSLVPPSYTGSSGIRRRMGGRSLYWYGVALPIEPGALTEPWWPGPVICDLCESWRGEVSLYQRIQRRLSEWRAQGADAPHGLVDDVSARELGSLWLRRTPRAIRHCTADSRRWRAYTPLDSWRAPLSGRAAGHPPGVRLVPHAQVQRVIVHGGKVASVAIRHGVTGEQAEIAAPIVVLAAGTMENSRLAIQVLTQVGALTRPRLPGLSDHLVQGIFLRLEPRHAAPLLDVLQPGSYYAPGPEPARSNLFLDVQSLPAGGVLVDLQMTGEQLPSAENYIECRSSARQPWPVTVHAVTSPDDRMVLEAQRNILASMWKEIATITGHTCTELDFGEFGSPERTNAVVLPESIRIARAGEPVTWSGLLGTEDHEGGTLPLGTILDEDGEFTAVRGLFAAGPSTFPRMGAANPSLTTLALTHRLAAVLAERH